MISRHQRIVFWVLLACIVIMAGVLVWERQRDRDRIAALGDTTPLDSPTASTEPVTFYLANDDSGTIAASERQIALPTETTARVRAMLDHLNAEYALPGSAHPLQPGAMVDDVFLLTLPIVGHAADTTGTATTGTPTTETTNPGTATIGSSASAPSVLVPSTDPNALQPISPGGQLAVINLRGSFVNQHPSGVEAESLTLLSIIGTLHANFPQIEQIRFLVDGQPRETLAGHADLLRTYPSRDTTLAATPADTP